MMPEAIFLMRWSPKRGPVVQGSYPPDADLEKEFLIDVLGSIIQEEEERIEGFYPITLAGKNVINYYSGEELNQVFGIVLEEGEKEREFRGGLVQATARILKKGGAITSEKEWGDLWDWVENYPDMTREERVLDAFRDPSMDTILSILTEEGVLTMDEVIDRTTVREELSRDVVMTYVHILEALEILDTRWDEEALEERVYLLRDLLIYRRKPGNYEEIAGQIKGYKNTVSTYLEKYKRDMLWKEDERTLPELLSQPGMRKVIERFEDEGVIDREAVDDTLNSKIEKLVDHRIIGKTDDVFYYFTAPVLELIYPEYTISRILAKARDEETPREDVVEFLQTVKDSYL